MPTDLSTKGIPTSLNGFKTMLKNLQGNILKGHGRDHTVNIFLEFNPVTPAMRKELLKIIKPLVTSALTQHDETVQFKKYKIPGRVFGNFFLTAKGYRALGFSQADLDAKFIEKPDSVTGLKSNFKQGLQAHAAELHDPDPKDWDEGFSEGKIDAMLLLADDDVDYLLRLAREVMHELESVASILTVERGDALRTKEGEGIEHFGYVDGRSQPIYFDADLEAEGNTDAWDPREPLSRVLVPDPFAETEDAFGSYYVFRKLEQNVLEFKIREHQLAQALELQGADRERAGAMAVGRFEDGTPLVLSQTDGFLPKKENNFNYDADPQGLKCPFHAHIRKTNPRGDVVRELGIPEEQGERSHRITRRGITYGKREIEPTALPGLDDLPSENVGLLFQCFQESIARQFAFMQATWSNNENFVRPNTGQDPVIGQAAAGAPAIPQQWRKEWGGQPGQAATPFSFGEFVKMKGGEFFFAPSMPFLKKLS